MWGKVSYVLIGSSNKMVRLPCNGLVSHPGGSNVTELAVVGSLPCWSTCRLCVTVCYFPRKVFLDCLHL